jgi:hypothetical protein
VRGTGAPIDGSVNVDANVLQGWGAASLLLGGKRSGDGRLIDVVSDSVRFASGASLSGTEVLAVARQEVRLDAGSALSSGDDAKPLAFDDDAPIRLEGEDSGAAVLGVSANRALFVERAGTAVAGGTVTMAAGSNVSTRGALLIDGPEAIHSAGVISGAAPPGRSARATSRLAARRPVSSSIPPPVTAWPPRVDCVSRPTTRSTLPSRCRSVRCGRSCSIRPG